MAALATVLAPRGAAAAVLSLGAFTVPTTLLEPFLVPIEIANGVQVTSWDLDLEYDPDVVRINDPAQLDLFGRFATEGGYFASGAPFNLLLPGVIDLDPITLQQTGLLFGLHGAYGGFPPLPSGDGVLAYVEFAAVGDGDPLIDIPRGEVTTSVSEPGSLALCAVGIAALLGMPRPRRRAVLGVFLLAFMVAPRTADAQIVANGPYYAVPSWDQSLPSSTRFIVLSNMNGEAVLDRETGLVWERTPGPATTDVWVGAQRQCLMRAVAGHRGWRLPEAHELLSLMGPAVSQGDGLEAGHPFDVANVSHGLWTSTITLVDESGGQNTEIREAPFMVSLTGIVFTHAVNGISEHPVWCVRGPA